MRRYQESEKRLLLLHNPPILVLSTKHFARTQPASSATEAESIGHVSFSKQSGKWSH